MKTLQDVFESQTREQFSFDKIAARLVEKRLQALGITPTKAQLAELESTLRNVQSDAITLSIDESQLPRLDPKSEEAIKDGVSIDLGDSEQELDELVEEITKVIPEVMRQVVEEMSELTLKRLKRGATSMLKNRRSDSTSFEAHIARVWRKPLDLLEMFLEIALEAGSDFNEEFRPKASEEKDYVFEVLTRLHARACQIASEVLVLLKSGHADGAHARWRSLHEIAVVGFFIKSSGNEIAERYLLHDAIESYKAAQLYKQYCEALGYEPYSAQELAEIESTYCDLISRFGPDYREEYGWAAPAIRKQRPTFRDIEQEAGLDRLRPFYKMASHNVHANPKGIFFRLGLYPESQDTLLAGPSDTGLTDPGHGTAISLAQITLALLTTVPNIDRLVICSILDKLQDEIGEAFLSVQKSLERDGVP